MHRGLTSDPDPDTSGGPNRRFFFVPPLRGGDRQECLSSLPFGTAPSRSVGVPSGAPSSAAAGPYTGLLVPTKRQIRLVYLRFGPTITNFVGGEPKDPVNLSEYLQPAQPSGRFGV